MKNEKSEWAILSRNSTALLLLFNLACTTLPTEDHVGITKSTEDHVGITKSLEDLRTEVNTLKEEVRAIELANLRYNNARFDPAEDQGYQRLDTSIGSFAVSIGCGSFRTGGSGAVERKMDLSYYGSSEGILGLGSWVGQNNLTRKTERLDCWDLLT